MDWSEDKSSTDKTFVMDADSRYMVERWGLGSWTAWFDGYRISADTVSLGSRAEAQKFAEAHRDAPEQRIVRAQRLIREFGAIAGDHHRAWVIRSVQAVLAGREPDYTDQNAP